MLLDAYVDPTTGGYEQIDNKLTYVNPVVNKVNILLAMPVGSYIYAPQNGNPLLSEEGIVPLSDVSNAINKCLQPLIQSGELVNVTVLSVQLNPVNYKYIINIQLILPSGENPPPLTWNQ